MTTTHQPYFLSLTLSNVRCFAAPQTLRLTRPNGRPARFTFLLGENGTGKTTLLQALMLLAPRFKVPGHTISVETELSRDPARTVSFLRGHSSAGSSVEARVAFPGADGVETVARERWEVRPVHTAGQIIGAKYRDTVTPVLPMVCLGYAPLRAWWLPIERAWSSNDVAGLFKGITLLEDPGAWYLQRDYAANNRRNTDEEQRVASVSRDRVAAILKAVLPGVSELVPVTLDAANGVTELFAVTPYGRVRVVELGLGYQTTLAWVVDLAARMMAAYPNSEDPLAEPAVVLIDEIDLHLHPTWQRTLLAELSQRFPNVQFIATAHSPLIVQAAPDANVAVLRREGDHVVIDQSLPSVRHWRVDQILTSDLFGLPSARTADLDAPLARRDALLAKPTLTDADERELTRLRDELGAMPGGETPWEMKAMEVIRRAALSLEDRPGVRGAVIPAAKPRPKKAKATKGAARKKPSRKKPARRTR